MTNALSNLEQQARSLLEFLGAVYDYEEKDLPEHALDFLQRHVRLQVEEGEEASAAVARHATPAESMPPDNPMTTRRWPVLEQ